MGYVHKGAPIKVASNIGTLVRGNKKWQSGAWSDFILEIFALERVKIGITILASIIAINKKHTTPDKRNATTCTRKEKHP